MSLMDFSTALVYLKMGRKVRREGWNGKGMSVGLQNPDAHSANTLPYLYMITASGDRVPWLASQMDLIEEDWVAIEEDA